ncbi:hypothetical protein QEV83_13900 [Methylocapsa sp. D3K7]|uniref:hypothetical protein n=1 Tax=Methylocapsa sp. D3K7 TaxID=3041435 RepID=UPI00244EA925|nr:hypothetical protein [Methylocapsa sp. D3K7]WGJ13769.1 hypothetical protein QEV83_13900 [Methylocapsa sp. D3K7]
MIGRLANVIYWIGCGLAATLLLLTASTAVDPQTWPSIPDYSVKDEWSQAFDLAPSPEQVRAKSMAEDNRFTMFCLAISGCAAWGIGRAARYVLAGQ